MGWTEGRTGDGSLRRHFSASAPSSQRWGPDRGGECGQGSLFFGLLQGGWTDLVMLKSITRDDVGTCDCQVPTRIRELACAHVEETPQNKAERLTLPCPMPPHWPLPAFSCPRLPTQWDQSLTSPQPPSAVGSAWPPHLTPPPQFFCANGPYFMCEYFSNRMFRK